MSFQLQKLSSSCICWQAKHLLFHTVTDLPWLPVTEMDQLTALSCFGYKVSVCIDELSELMKDAGVGQFRQRLSLISTITFKIRGVVSSYVICVYLWTDSAAPLSSVKHIKGLTADCFGVCSIQLYSFGSLLPLTSFPARGGSCFQLYSTCLAPNSRQTKLVTSG